MTKLQSIQDILGVEADGKWGPKSQAALDALSKQGSHYSEVFLDFMPFIFEWEGETFENDPDDPGGATKFGIDQRSHPGVDIRELTKDQAMDIYWKEWLDAGCDRMFSPYGEIFFNCAVNMGVGRAREFDARAEGHPNTFLGLQEAKYLSIADAHKGMAKFLKGWLNRTSALRRRFNVST